MKLLLGIGNLRNLFVQLVTLFRQDFANQVYYSRDYIQACEAKNLSRGKYVSPTLAEHFAG